MHGISQARILGGLSPPARDLPNAEVKPASLYVSCIVRQVLFTSTTWEAPHPHPREELTRENLVFGSSLTAEKDSRVNAQHSWLAFRESIHKGA